MARKSNATPKPSGEDQPSTETLRVASDLVEMLREICFHSRDSRSRRLKITAVVDELLRPAVTKRHREVMQRVEKEKPSGENSEGGA